MAKKIFILILFIFLGLCIYTNLPKKIQIRPIKIKIIDKTDNKPLRNIIVYYAVEIHEYESNVALVFPNFNPQLKNEKLKILKQINSNNDGIVEINEKNIWIGNSEIINKEIVFINIDVKNDNIKEQDKKISMFEKDFSFDDDYIGKNFFNPNKAYRGCVINSWEWNFNPEEWGGSKREKYDIIWNSHSLQKESEYIVVKLNR